MEKQLIGKEARDKISHMTEIKVDPVRWFVFYIDENGDKWKEDRPNSEHHGGGEPRLSRIESFPWEEE